MIQFKSIPILMRIKSLQCVETTKTFSHSLEDRGRTLLSSLRHGAHPHLVTKLKPKAKEVGEGYHTH
jgi:hypothetical protein